MKVRDRAAKARELVRSALPGPCRDQGRSWIGGEWIAVSAADTFETLDPTTGESLLRVEIADASQVTTAVNAAVEAGKAWWNADGRDRSAVLWEVACGIRRNRDSLAVLDTLDAGRPIRDTTLRDVERAARIFEFFAGVSDRLRGAAIPVQPGFNNRTQLEPYGVVGAIIPWNYPLTNAATKIAPALATGNAVILKPAEQTPLSALLLAAIAHDSGVPPGLLNVVNGPGEVTGDAIVAAPGVDKIAFTGSTQVGRHIAASAGAALKSVTLELGGKSPCIIFEDSDIAAAAEAAIFSTLSNQGQTCTAATRLIVSRKIVDGVIDAMAAIARQLRVGDPLEPETMLGPLVAAEQLKRVQSYVDIGTGEGATFTPFVVDWRANDFPGYFIRPGFFSGVSSAMRISQEEIFGPVMTILPFDTEEEALALANDTKFGLAASIWTENLRRAERVASRIKAGIIWINAVHTLHPGSPYGGYHQSGLGLEMGLEAVSQFVKTKSIWTAIDEWRSPWAMVA